MNRRTQSKQQRSHRPNRNGMATLEFVLGFPFLLFIFAAIYSVSWAGVNRSKVIQRSRHEVWKMRDKSAEHNLESLNRNSDTKPLSIPIPTKTVKQALDPNIKTNGNEVERENMPGEIWGSSLQNFRTYEWLGGDRRAQAFTGLIDGPWDHKEVDDLDGPLPHAFEVVHSMMGGLKPNGLGQDGASGITGIFNAPSK